MGSGNAIVQRLWNYCNVLRDDGLSYGNCVEQLTFLLFLEMADQRTRPPYNQPSATAGGFDWPSLLARDGDELETHYRHVLSTLGESSGIVATILRIALSKIQDPARLRRLIVDRACPIPTPSPTRSSPTWSRHCKQLRSAVEEMKVGCTALRKRGRKQP